MSRWAERARARKSPPEALTKPTEGAERGLLAVLSVPTPRPFSDEDRVRLRTLASAAGCPVGYVDKLHPLEAAEYVDYSDADVVASLRHLATCATCLERQTRRVTCGTCRHFAANPTNPGAGMGSCGCGASPEGGPLYPRLERHCVEWRPAA